jgi:eukaryotic-like serine/threonine-protein kinase
MSAISPELRAIFSNALELGSEEERRAYLDRACQGNADLRARIDALLLAHHDLGEFLEQPVPPPSATWDAPGPLEAPGTTIGPYKLMEQIGEGGFGLVFVAEQQQPVRRKVALKVIKPGMDSRQVIARFEAERQALALMDHPGIARVLDAGTTEAGRPYFVMELVRGIPITDYCDRNLLTPRERLAIFVDVCHAIQHAHQKGIIHRDVKPSNVLVTSHDGKPVAKVIDFGVAKAIHQHLTERTIYTQFAQMIGTPLYMSPEQAEMSGLDVDTRSYIYSLGVLLYELLTGSTPLESKQLRRAAYDEMRRLIREEEPPRPSQRLSTLETLPSVAACRKTEPAKLSRMMKGELDWVVMKALEKDRTRRYETANGLARDLQRYLADEVVEARPASSGYRLRKFARRNRAALATTTTIGLLLIAGIVVSTWQAVRARGAEIAAIKAADAERLAKLDAEAQKSKAMAAAAAEKEARGQAQRRLTQIEKGNEIITSIFTELDIRKVREGTEPLEAVLAERLVKAAGQLEGEAVGDPLVVAGLQDRLGVSLLSLGHPREAIPLFVKARETHKSLLGDDHPDTLMTMNNLGIGYQDAGRLDLALTLLEETLKLRKAAPGADHPETLLSMNNLAAGYIAAGKPDLALPLLEQALKLRKAKLGTDHPHTITSMNNLAMCYQAVGKLELALPLLDQTRKLSKAKLGADHPDTLDSMNNLAMGYRAGGKLDLALPLLEETLKLSKAKQGADHPSTLTVMNNLALGYQEAGKLDLALPLLKETLKLWKAKKGADHPSTLTSMNNLALGYRAAGKLDLALPLFQESAVGIEKRQFQYEHAGNFINNLAYCLEQLKRLDQAEAWRRKWLAVVKERAGTDSVAYAGELAGLGVNLLQQQKWTEAEMVLRECLALRAKQQPDAWTTFSTRSMFGGALLGQKKYAEAESLLLNGYDGMKKHETTIPTPGKVRLTDALERLVQLYEAKGNKDEAAKWRKELEGTKAVQASKGATQP